jgi:trigger factor
MVSTEIKEISNCKKELKISIPAGDIEAIRKEQIINVQKEAQIQGFRKGKAPRHMVMNLYAGTIEKYTLDEALEKGFQDGIKEANIVPFGQPMVKKFDYDENKNLNMEVEVETYPEIDLKKYKGLKIEKNIYKITDEDVEDRLLYIRKQKATITPVKEAAQEGHNMMIDMQELDETGMPLIGKKYDDIRINLGEGTFDPEIEHQLIGLKVGEDKVIEKKYDQKSSTQQKAGKTERFKITVKSIEEEELPQADDDFVKDLNIGIETIDKLKVTIKEQLQHDWGQESEQHFYNQLAHELLQENPFEVPESMVSGYLDQIVNDISKRDSKVDVEEVRKTYRVDALFNIKWYHLKEKIAQEENIRTDDNDFDEYLEKIDDTKIRERYQNDKDLKKRVLNDLYEKKIFDFLVSNSKVTEKEQPIKKRKEFEAV